MSNRLSEDPITYASNRLSKDPITYVSNRLSKDQITYVSNRLSKDPIAHVSNRLSKDPIAHVSNRLSKDALFPPPVSAQNLSSMGTHIALVTCLREVVPPALSFVWGVWGPDTKLASGDSPVACRQIPH